jgi:hypothetical protein
MFFLGQGYVYPSKKNSGYPDFGDYQNHDNSLKT